MGDGGLRVDASEAMAATRVGCFVWEPDSGRFLLDACGLAVFDLRADEYDGLAASLGQRIPQDEVDRLIGLVADIRAGRSDTYSSYFRIRCRDGSLRWTHTQGKVIRGEQRADAEPGADLKVVGVVRDATQELSYSAQRLVAEDDLRRQEDAIREVARALADALSVDDVVGVLTGEHSMRRLGTQGVSLAVMDQGRLRVVGAAGPSDTLVRELQSARLSESWPLNDAVRGGEPLYFTSRSRFLARYPRLADFLAGTRLTAAAFLPLIAQGRPIGAMGLIYDGRRRFSIEDRTLLTALSSGIAQSMQRAMLVDQAREIAAGLQNAMLPRYIPQVAGGSIAVRYRTARVGTSIGGDWYDAMPLPGRSIGIAVGDVQGHDTEAAAIMGQLRIAMTAYAAEGHPAETVLQRASAFLRDLDADRFATCFYAHVSLATGSVWAANAGHLPPFVRSLDGSVRRLDLEAGPPLGLPAGLDAPPYGRSSFHLDPGDTLLLCSDGLVERSDEDLDQGLARLTTALGTGPHELEPLADHLMESLADRLDLEDDAACLLLRRDAASVDAG
ncbi:hypothetical protein ABIA33_000865 [Streptacidiphilus sp. MAP12-16]|uniref:SpoIIE family protein phosphatase n=1 Tax=Streptacidiphilus sp. MAP12-16 TaxID=3156300 RepID=UPI0035120050